MDQTSHEERRRIAELMASGGALEAHQEINRSRFAIRQVVVALYRPAQREPGQSAR